MTDITAKVAQSFEAPHQMPKPLPAGYVEWLYGKAFDPSEPRDERGRWEGDGGDSGDGGDKGDGHPGKGYSASAYVKDGVIHTNSVYDAQRALFENRKVELDQPRTVSVLIHKLGEISKKMIEQGKAAPVFNLCNVSIKGTNLFCADSKGIPRVEMPQLDKQQTKDFQKYLKDQGYKVKKDKEYASHLRATQNELNGAKVAAGAEKIIENGGKVKPIIISKDDYVLDGHHAWAAKLGLDAASNDLEDNTKMHVVRVNIKITKLLEEADKFTGGKGRKGVDEPNKSYVSFGEVFRDWDESKHPRDEHGEWTDGGGGGDESSGVGSDRQMGPTTADRFVAARGGSKRTAFLSDKSTEDLKSDQLFLSGDGKAGYALDPHHDLQNLFNNGPKGGGKVALDDAIKKGAATLDAFDGHLPMLYAKHGFVPTGRMKFSDEYAPKGWNYDKYGRPDVVFMAYRGGDRQTIEERAGTFPPYDRSQGTYFTDYDAAKAASRGAVLDKGFGPGVHGVNGASPEHRGRGGFHQALERAQRRAAEAGERLQLAELIERGLSLEDTRRVYVRSRLMEAHRAISMMEAEGFVLIPYDGEHIPGTDLIDLAELEERVLRADPKTLYVHRQLLNAEEVIDWAKSQGFEKTITPDDMHVTVAFSRAPVDWDLLDQDRDPLTITGGRRSVDRLGADGEAVVLRFESAELQKCWQKFFDAGASWDYDDYKPHVTISFDAPDIDVADIEPFTGELLFGPEVFAVLNDDWKTTITERTVDYIQDPVTGHLMGSHGSGDSDKDGGDKEPAKPEPSPEVMAVGGDEWNKQTAERLEKEYVEAEPALEKIISDALTKETKVEDPEDVEEPDPDDAPVVPEEWAMLSDDQQSDVESAWKSSTESSYMDSEIESWQESNATDDAGNELAWAFKQGTNTEWAKDAIDEYASQWVDEHDDKELPFTNLQLLDALVVDFDNSGYNDFGKVDISFDDSKLDHPAGWSNEPTLPGIEPQDPSSLLTKEMRDGLIAGLTKAFAKEGEDVQYKLEPPEYLKESVDEYQDQVWGDMEDKEKFAMAEKHTDIVSDAQKEYDAYFGKSDKPVEETKFVMPEKLDPLQEEGGKNYAGTQKVARLLSVERAAQLMVARGTYDDIGKARTDAKRMDRELWNGWKGSSSGYEGQTLQKATAEELGGRLNPMMVDSPKEIIEISQSLAKNAEPGKAYEAVKAYVRGKWETSQYLLKKAGLDTVNVYRGVDIPDAAPPSVIGPGTGGDYRVTATKTFDDEASANRYMEDRAAEHGKDYSGSISKFHDSYRVLNKYEFRDKAKAEAFAKKYETDPDNPEQHKEEVAGTSSIPDKYSSAPPPKFTRLPDIHIDRNGAASTTTASTVANAWDGSPGRVVLRASVPRTAVVSVPAYGINIVGEHEVVVAGTAWKGWDAWKGKAPLHEQVKIGHQIVGHPDA